LGGIWNLRSQRACQKQKYACGSHAIGQMHESFRWEKAISYTVCYRRATYCKHY